jgi:hypothetical protein
MIVIYDPKANPSLDRSFIVLATVFMIVNFNRKIFIVYDTELRALTFDRVTIRCHARTAQITRKCQTRLKKLKGDKFFRLRRRKTFL